MEVTPAPCTHGDLNASLQKRADDPPSKRRKDVPKTVVTVRIEAPAGRQKGEGPPSDSWSWRKYGQKPIKGSPYPRGYYRCSTSKGCSAKKQVERCKTDASVLIITYTSTHNHPGPEQPKVQPQNSTESSSPTPTCSQVIKEDEPTSTDPPPPLDADPHLQAPKEEHKEEDVQQFTDEADNTGPLNVLFDVPPSSSPQHILAFSTAPKDEENDFFDELEELPISSSFTGIMRSSFFDERILLPSYTN